MKNKTLSVGQLIKMLETIPDKKMPVLLDVQESYHRVNGVYEIKESDLLGTYVTLK